MYAQKYIEPLLFGRKKKKKTVEEKIDDMNKNVLKNITELTNEMQRVRQEVSSRVRNDSVINEFGGFKSDLDAIKGLLLNR